MIILLTGCHRESPKTLDACINRATNVGIAVGSGKNMGAAGALIMRKKIRECVEKFQVLP